MNLSAVKNSGNESSSVPFYWHFSRNFVSTLVLCFSTFSAPYLVFLKGIQVVVVVVIIIIITTVYRFLVLLSKSSVKPILLFGNAWTGFPGANFNNEICFKDSVFHGTVYSFLPLVVFLCRFQLHAKMKRRKSEIHTHIYVMCDYYNLSLSLLPTSPALDVLHIVKCLGAGGNPLISYSSKAGFWTLELHSWDQCTHSVTL